jgi:hypothetical protein
MAWLENNLLAGLRIPYKGAERRKLAQYGAAYRSGMIKPCPFTGMCYDENMIKGVVKAVRAGYTLGDCFRWLAGEATRLIEAEYEYANSDEYIAEHLDVNDWQFLENGKAVKYIGKHLDVNDWQFLENGEAV